MNEILSKIKDFIISIPKAIFWSIKTFIQYYWLWIILIIVIFVGGTMLLRGCSILPDHRGGTPDTGERIDRVEEQQQSVIDSLGKLSEQLGDSERRVTVIKETVNHSVESVDRITEAASGSQATVEECTRLVRDSQSRIETCEDILARVRSRAQKK